MYATAVVAAANFSCAAAGDFGCAVLSMPGQQAAGVPAWVENFGKTTTDHEVGHIGFDAARRARFGVYAPIRADNSAGPGGPTGPLDTPFRTPCTLSSFTKTQ